MQPDAIDYRDGPGLATADELRKARGDFWSTFADAIRDEIGELVWRLSDDEPIVGEFFRLIEVDG